MNIHVALIDKSEIVKKMLSHCLYYFAPEVSRFDNLEDCLSHYSDKKPDIVFVDWGIKKGEKLLISSVIKEFKETPIVLIYQTDHHIQVNQIPKEEIKYRIAKPLVPEAIRNLFIELVPKAKESKIHAFLKFPQSNVDYKDLSLDSVEVSSPDSMKLSPPDSVKLSPPDSVKLSPPDSVKLSPPDSVKLSPPDSVKLSPPDSIKMSPVNLEKIVIMDPFKTSPEDFLKASSANPLKTSLEDKTLEKKEEISIQNKKTSIKPDLESNRSGLESLKKGFNKAEVKIDDNTHSDFAPTTMESAHFVKEGDLQLLNEADILKILNTYKDTIEFQKIMENVVSEYAKEIVIKLLQGDKIIKILKQPLAQFTEGQKFKELVEKYIYQDVKKQLPLTIKKIVQEEIQKILES